MPHVGEELRLHYLERGDAIRMKRDLGLRYRPVATYGKNGVPISWTALKSIAPRVTRFLRKKARLDAVEIRNAKLKQAAAELQRRAEAARPGRLRTWWNDLTAWWREVRTS